MNYSIYETAENGDRVWERFAAMFLSEAEIICEDWKVTGEIVDNNNGEIVRCYEKGVQTYPTATVVC